MKNSVELTKELDVNDVENFIYSLENNQKEIALHLHGVLCELGLQAKIRYRVPFYFGKSWICYVNPKKNDAIELAMLRGNEMSDGQGLLQFNGRKQVSGIIFESVKDIPNDLLHEILNEAILLDETVKYSVRKK